MIQLTEQIVIPDRELHFSTCRSSGPGGQHVNKTASAVQLRFDITRSPSIPDPLRERMLTKLSHRINRDGTITVRVEAARSQYRNRCEAEHRLQTLLQSGMQRSKRRRPTRPGRAAVERRLQSKNKRSRTKQLRRPPQLD